MRLFKRESYSEQVEGKEFPDYFDYSESYWNIYVDILNTLSGENNIYVYLVI